MYLIYKQKTRTMLFQKSYEKVINEFRLKYYASGSPNQHGGVGNTVLISSHGHIKITTKLQSNHGDSPEV